MTSKPITVITVVKDDTKRGDNVSNAFYPNAMCEPSSH